MENNSTIITEKDPRLQLISDVKPQKHLNRFADLKQNCEQVRREFVGKPEVCHELVVHIIHLRRGKDVGKHLPAFCELLANYLPTLLEHLDVRWLVSILDTMADYGSPEISARAMMLVVLLNNTNIHQTILDAAGGKLNHSAPKRPSWGGMLTVDLEHGDMIFNMMNRVNRIVESDPLMKQIWNRIKQIAASEDLVMNRLCKRHTQPEWRRYI